MADIWINILNGLPSALIGGGIAFLIAYIMYRLGQQRKTVEYETFSMALVRFKPTPERPLVVSVDKSLLTASKDDKGKLVQVDNAYGFEVEILNTGNQPISNCTIEIELDEDAKIIEVETLPPSKSGYGVEIMRNIASLNILQVVPSYINKKEAFMVRLTSTGNRTRKCNVNVMGMGLQVQQKRSLNTTILGFTALIYVFLTLTVMLTELSTEKEIAKWILVTFNMGVKQETRIDFPKWLPFLTGAIVISAFYWMFRILLSLQRQRRRRSKTWGMQSSRSSRISISSPISFLLNLLGYDDE